MANAKLSDAEAKAILLKWPGRTSKLWPPPAGKGFWLRGQPKSGYFPGPTLASPGASLFKSQPDGLWVHFRDVTSCDVVVIEVCGTAQNLNDKRSRYIPASHSVVLTCSRQWLSEKVKVQRGGEKARWIAAGTFVRSPRKELAVPVRHLRVLYAIPNELYDRWSPHHVPTGYEFFCPHSSLDTYNSQSMQAFLGQMSIAAQFYKKVKKSS